MLKSIKLLHLEDEQSIVKVTQRLLEKEGFEVDVCHVQRQDEFITAIEQQDFDLVIADYYLPEFDGLSALRLLRERNSDVPFILFSGEISVKKAIESLRNGATDYVLKKNIKALGSVVKRALREVEERRHGEKLQQVVYHIASAAISASDDMQFYAIIQEELGKLINTDNFFIGLYEHETDSIYFPYIKYEKKRFKKVMAANTISSLVIKNKKSVMLKGRELEQFFREKKIKRIGAPAQSCLGVPLMTDENVIGLIIVQSYEKESAFNEDDIHLLEFAANQLASSIKKKQAEDKLQKLHFQNKQMLLAFPSILIVIDKDERIIRWNPKAKEAFGHDWTDVRQKNLFDVEIPWDMKMVEQAILKSRETGQTVRLENLKFQKPDKTARFLNLIISPLNSEGHAPEGYMVQGEDITEKKIIESQLAQAQKLESIGQLAAGIAHEINTPAQYVGDNAYFLKDSFNELMKLLDVFGQMQAVGQDENRLKILLEKAVQIAEDIDLQFLIEEIPAAVEQTLDGIGKVSKIVKAMKEFSHPGSKDKTMVDLNRAIDNTITICRNEWKYVADVDTEFDASLPLVSCFPDEFNQVILNIIINAAHAIGDIVNEGVSKGKITIRTKQKGNMAEISISDTGKGIPKSIIKKIFDPFFTTKEVGKGTGQGLAISYDVIVNKHGGTLAVESEPGKGATFIIRLPLDG